MRANAQRIIEAIDTAPLNRGLKGADWVATPGNVAFTFDNGDVALFDYEGDDTYQGHFLFKSRGRQAIEHAREAFRRLFTEHDAGLVFGLVPDFRRDAKMVVRWAGGKSRGLRNTQDGPCELFVLSKFMWKVANQ
jgi:hypothetical protein